MPTSRGMNFVKRTLDKFAPNRDKTSDGSSNKTKALTSASSATLANSVYSETLEDFSRTLTDQPNLSDKYPVLKLNEHLAVSIGDSFEANPSSLVEATARFEYGKTRHPKAIRLLLIFPAAHHNDVLETIMFHAELDEVPFQVLSHTNPDKRRIEWMHCNGRGLAVSESMYQALLDVRNVAEPDAFSIIWVEAVCIDQDDVHDREKHLRLVRDIFSSSHVTLAHLGGTEEQRERAFETIDKLHEACKYDEFRDRLEEDEIDLSSLSHLSVADVDLEIPPENRLEITRLFSHHWFERIWNWQEVGLSKKVCIMYGGGLRTWGYIANAAWCMYQLRWETSVGDDCLPPGNTREDLKHYHILHLDEHRTGALEGKTFPLLGLLTESRHFTASNPLDRVFALYSHVGNSRERHIIEAFFDYSLPPLDLYLNVTLNCILSHRTLDVLHLTHNNETGYWPSFVPDLTKRDNMRMLGSRNGRKAWEYQASAETAPQLAILNHRGETREGIPWFSDDVRIVLKGITVDEITAVGTEMKGPTLGSHTFLADWVNTALMTEGDKFYTTPELKRARELLQSTMKDQNLHGGKNPETNGTWVSRRTSLAGTSNRQSITSAGEPRPYLRSTFAPALIEALQKLDIDSEAARGLNGEMDPMAILPHDKTYPVWNISVVEAFWRTLIRNRDDHGQEPNPAMGTTHFQPWFKAMSGSVSHMLDALAHGQSDAGPRPEPLFNDLVHMSCNGTRIVRTQNGFIGTVPRTARKGDLVCVLFGGQTPFVLRRDVHQEGLYRLVGDCYVHGLMNGEALNMELEEQKFEIH